MRWRAVMLAALGAALGAAGTARAGGYQVVACNAPGGAGVNASWHLAYSGGASAAAFNPDPTGRCAGSNGAELHTAPGNGAVPKGGRAAWTFRAPAGDVVTHVTVWRQGKAREGWQVAARAGGRLLERCAGSGTTFCTLGAAGFSLNSRKDFAVASSPVVSWGLECIASKPCPTGTAGVTNGLLDLQGARVTVSDPLAPSVGAGGALLAGGFRRSGDVATVTATDASGIRELALLVDGAARATVPEACDFHRPAPCPSAASATLSPGALSDGTHGVTLEALDAAGNAGRVDHAVVVDGSPPDAVLEGIEGRRITVAVSDRVSGVTGGQLLVRTSSAGWTPLATSFAHGRLTAVAPRAARHLGIRVVASDGAGNLLDAVVTSLRLWAHVGGRRHGGWVRHGRVSVPYGRAVSLSGQLTTTDGVRLAHQAVAITGTLHRLGARAERIDVATTDAHGRFRLRLRAGPSRTLTVAYPGAPGLLRATAGVALRVAAWASIHASPRVLFGRGRVRFSGRLGLRGARVPPSGKLIDLEAFDAGRWRIFATARARGRHGVWRASNLFSGRPGRFPIRVRIRRESTFPYELGYSRAVTVVVR